MIKAPEHWLSVCGGGREVSVGPGEGQAEYLFSPSLPHPAVASAKPAMSPRMCQRPQRASLLCVLLLHVLLTVEDKTFSSRVSGHSRGISPCHLFCFP